MSSDIALARRVLAGEESAFDEFFASYFPRLYRFALARLGGREDVAEEVVQSALIKAVAGLHTYKGEAALFTWLCTVCRREISSWLGRVGQTREVSLFDDRPEIRATLDVLATLDLDDPESALRRRELSHLVQVTLDHLPSRYGDALEWKYIQELSVDEIADRLGLSYKAAESLLTRAREAFREGFPLVAGGPRLSEGS
jgi:RNA polymerase sigma-70 factor (ECF subfamily)